jgi:glutaredoxin
MFSLYVKPGCPYCADAIETVISKNIAHKVIELKTEKRREDIKKKHNYSTFPQIFFKKTFIGGNDEFQAIVAKCDQLNNMFDNMPPKLLKTVIEICCALSTTKNSCSIGKISNTNTKKIIRRKKK